jgi:tetratricopeptide (TPR) repeat protein
MTPEERDTLEAKGDRAMRRGELSAALALFQQLCSAFPLDSALAEKLANLKENLQPMELTSAKSRFVPDPSAPRSGGNPLDEAEALAARGDYPGAIARYRKALADKPDSELLKERLAELFRMMQAHAPQRPPPVVPKSPELALTELLDRIASRRKR